MSRERPRGKRLTYELAAFCLGTALAGFGALDDPQSLELVMIGVGLVTAVFTKRADDKRKE